MLLLSISVSRSVDLALAFILLMKQETMKERKKQNGSALELGMLWEMRRKRRKQFSLHWALSTSCLIPKRWPLQDCHEIHLESHCVLWCKYESSQIEPENLKVMEFDWVLYLNCLVLNSSLLFPRLSYIWIIFASISICLFYSLELTEHITCC